MSLEVIRTSPHNSPTYSSRLLAYLGITMYESVVHSSLAHRSMAGQLSDRAYLPKPEPGLKYNWALVLNAGQASMLNQLYPHAYRSAAAHIDSLQRAITVQLSATEAPEMVERSMVYGWALANAIFNWSDAFINCWRCKFT